MTCLDSIWDELRPGETVIIEYSSLLFPAVVFYQALMWASKRNYKIIIDDVLDSLYLYKVHLQLAGLSTDIFDSIEIIKEGGVLPVGRVASHLELKQYGVRKVEYERAYKLIMSRTEEKQIVNLVVGAEKLFLISNVRENINTLNLILSYMGDKRKITLYFINKDLLEVSGAYLLPLLEELATTVIRIDKRNERYVVSVAKSINSKLEGVGVPLNQESIGKTF